MSSGIFDTLKMVIQAGGYLAAFHLGKTIERPKDRWPRAKQGQNPLMVGDWELYRKIDIVVILISLFLLFSGGSLGGFGGGMGGGGMGGGYRY